MSLLVTLPPCVPSAAVSACILGPRGGAQESRCEGDAGERRPSFVHVTVFALTLQRQAAHERVSLTGRRRG